MSAAGDVSGSTSSDGTLGRRCGSLDIGQLLDAAQGWLRRGRVQPAGSCVPMPARWACQQPPVAFVAEKWVNLLQPLPGRGEGVQSLWHARQRVL